jgi:hypothetical protein
VGQYSGGAHTLDRDFEQRRGAGGTLEGRPFRERRASQRRRLRSREGGVGPSLITTTSSVKPVEAVDVERHTGAAERALVIVSTAHVSSRTTIYC